MDRLKKTIYGLLIPVIILAAWYFYTTYSNVPGSLLPQIQDVAGAFNEMVSDGQLQNDLSVSFIRVVKGFLVSGIIGIVLGAVMGMSKKAHAMLLPAITAIRQVPVIAWIPLIILWAGIGGTYSVNRLCELLGGEIVHIPKRPGEPDCTFADISKIEKRLGWKAHVTFEEGVQNVIDHIEYWREAPVWTPDRISTATEDWFKYLGKQKV